jgi:hypothetical protein
MSHSSRNPGFSYYFFLMIEGFESGSVLVLMDPDLDPGGPMDPDSQHWRIVIIFFQMLLIRIRIDFRSPESRLVLGMRIGIQKQGN